MKSIYLALIILCLPFLCLADQKIKIGVPTALSGGAATYGTDIKNALLFANQHLFGNRYEFIFEDDRCSGKEAVSAVQKLINQDKVKYVIGFACSGAMLAAAPILEKAQVLTISPSASAPAISQAGDYMFRTWPSDIGASKALLNFIKGKHKHMAILTEETEYAKGLEQSFLEQSAADKLKVLTETYLPGDSDIRTQLLKIKNEGADGLFINTQDEAGYALVLKQLREASLSFPVYGAYWPGSASLLSVAGSQAEGVIFADLPSLSDILSADGRKVFADFEKEYGKPNSAETVFACSVEALRSLDQAILSGQDPKSYLYQASFDGIFGSWGYDKNGDVKGLDQVMKVIKNGQKVALKDDLA